MRKSFLWTIIAILLLLLAILLVYRTDHSKIHKLYFLGNSLVQPTETGDTLEWRQLGSQEDFVVHFPPGGSPCVDKDGHAEEDVPSLNGVAKCKVSNQYGGFTAIYGFGTKGKKINWGGDDLCPGCICNGCITKGKGTSSGKARSDELPKSAAIADNSAVALLSCSSGKMSQLFANTSETGINWQPGGNAQYFSVTFPSSGSALCAEGQTFDQTHDTCTFIKPLVAGQTYTFTLNAQTTYPTNNPCPNQTSITFKIPPTQ